MTRLDSTLFVNTPGSRVTVERGALIVVTPDGGKSRFPIEPLERVALLGRSSMSTEALARCVAAGVRVASLTRSGRVRFFCSSPTSGNVHLRIAQVRVATDAKAALRFGRLIVAGKLRNSLNLVRSWEREADDPVRQVFSRARETINGALDRSRSAPTGDHLRGVEGDGARAYFKAMGSHLSVLEPPMNMLRRTRRPPADPVNAALSFGYGLLTSELVGAADVVGLDPQIGLFHVVRSGRPALALDLLEEQRAPVVDRFVVAALRRRQLRLEHFTETPGGAWYLSDDGRRQFIGLFDHYRKRELPHDLLQRNVPLWALPTLQMTVLARHLRGDIGSYVPWQAG